MGFPLKKRALPNILMTGTPGCGKSTLAKAIIDKISVMKWISVSDIVLINDLYEDYDLNLDSPIINEEKVLDYLEPLMKNGGIILEYFSCDFFPEHWFDIVFVITVPHNVLFSRLTERGYTGKKLENNLDYEIGQTAYQEALDCFSKDNVFKIHLENQENLEDYSITILGWIYWWHESESGR